MSADQTQHSVFFSYAREDQEDVSIAANLLIAGGAKVFMDVRDLDFGDRWENVLMEKLKVVQRVLVFWSKNAARSEWVAREYKTALRYGKRIVPVPIDDTPLSQELSKFHALMDFKVLLMKARLRSVSPTRSKLLVGTKNAKIQQPSRVVIKRRTGPGVHDFDLGKKAVELVFG